MYLRQPECMGKILCFRFRFFLPSSHSREASAAAVVHPYNLQFGHYYLQRFVLMLASSASAAEHQKSVMIDKTNMKEILNMIAAVVLAIGVPPLFNTHKKSFNIGS